VLRLLAESFWRRTRRAAVRVGFLAERRGFELAVLFGPRDGRERPEVTPDSSARAGRANRGTGGPTSVLPPSA
jgi:hypothetical protein